MPLLLIITWGWLCETYIGKMMLQTFHLIVGSCVGVLLSTTPVSRNVSAGTLVQITCASPETELTVFSLTTTPHIDGSDKVVTHPNGGTQHTLSFIAPVQHNIINIACIVVKGKVSNQSIAVLIIQGESFLRVYIKRPCHWMTKCTNKECACSMHHCTMWATFYTTIPT